MNKTDFSKMGDMCKEIVVSTACQQEKPATFNFLGYEYSFWIPIIGWLFVMLGWYIAHRHRTNLSRRMHTISLILSTNQNQDFLAAQRKIAPYVKNKRVPEYGSSEHDIVLIDLRFLLNHYEFVSAGIRNGDLDERLILDSWRGHIISLYNCSLEPHIKVIQKEKPATYEHYGWLINRWTSNRVIFTWFIEKIINKPMNGKRVQGN